MSRRVRAMFSLGALWAGTWGLVGFAYGCAQWLRFAAERHPAYGLFMWGVFTGLPYLFAGAICGVGFAWLFSHAERERSIDSLSLTRAAAWGGIAGAVAFFTIVLIWMAVLGNMVSVLQPLSYALFTGILGAVSAAVSLAVARAPRRLAGAIMPSESPDGLGTVRSDLRQLVLAQYAYFADHRAYAADLEELMAATDYRVSAGNQAELVGDREGFTATVRRIQATAALDRGTIWIGDHAKRASRELGVIYCE